MKLSKRERYLVTAASLVVAGFVLFHFVLSPFLERMATLRAGIESRGKSLREMAEMSHRYREITDASMTRSRMVGKRSKGFTLFSFLERAAGESSVKDRIKYMKPSSSPHESMVEMQMEEITLKQLVDYLQRIEYGDGLVQVKRISVRESRKETAYLDAVMQVVSPE
jgi:general secretion pathway protein M